MPNTFEFDTLNFLREAIAAHDTSPWDIKETFATRDSLHLEQKPMDEQSLAELLKKIAGLTPNSADKTYRNSLYGGKIPVATLADMLASYMNNSMYTFKACGIQTLIEKSLLSHMLKKVGYEKGDGTFAAGGSMSNMMAMLLARNEKIDTCKEHGIQGAELIAYTSDQGHYSIKKNAGILGMGRSSVRVVPSDEKGKMKADVLQSYILQDHAAGKIPYLINLTAGTTALGAFDPIAAVVELPEIQDLEIWVHVDASRGGGVLHSPDHAYLMDGVSKADSCTRNPHKMMNVPLSSSALLVQKNGLLSKHLCEGAPYLYQTETEDLNLGNKSLQCGRRNDAFKAWAAWKLLGDDGYTSRVQQQYAMVAHALQRIESSNMLTLLLDPECLNVCFTIKGHDAKLVCDALHTQGHIKVSYGVWKQESFVRLICVNADLGREGIDYFFDTLLDFVGQI